jgi:hypothetical protein
MVNLADIALYITVITGIIYLVTVIHSKWNEKLKWEAKYFQDSNGLGPSFRINKGGAKEIFPSRVEVFESRYFKKTEPTKLVINNHDPLNSQKFGIWWGTPETSSNAKLLDSAIKNKATIWLKVYYQAPSDLKTYEKWIKAEPEK